MNCTPPFRDGCVRASRRMSDKKVIRYVDVLIVGKIARKYRVFFCEDEVYLVQSAYRRLNDTGTVVRDIWRSGAPRMSVHVKCAVRAALPHFEADKIKRPG